MSVLLIAEHNNKEVKSFTLNAITAASQIDQDLHVLLIGHKQLLLQRLMLKMESLKLQERLMKD